MRKIHKKIHPELRKKASSPELREHDGCDFDAKLLIEQMGEKDQSSINEMLEKNYQRGFQQGIAAIEEYMECFSMFSLSRAMLKELVTAAGLMRNIEINGEAYSYDNYMHVLKEAICVTALMQGE